MIDVSSELMCSATKDTDPLQNVDEVAAWKLALPTQNSVKSTVDLETLVSSTMLYY